MNFMLAGIVLFFGPHIVSTLPSIKAMKVRLIGEKTYKVVFSLMSLLGLILLGYGMSQIGFKHLYMPINELRHAMPLFIWISLFLLASAHRPSNVKRITRHPMLWGITFWSASHLAVNGDLGAVLLFGPFFVYSLWAMLSANLRGAKKAVKFPRMKTDVIVAIATLFMTVGIMFAHGFLFGMKVM